MCKCIKCHHNFTLLPSSLFVLHFPFRNNFVHFRQNTACFYRCPCIFEQHSPAYATLAPGRLSWCNIWSLYQKCPIKYYFYLWIFCMQVLEDHFIQFMYNLCTLWIIPLYQTSRNKSATSSFWQFLQTYIHPYILHTEYLEFGFPYLDGLLLNHLILYFCFFHQHSHRVHFNIYFNFFTWDTLLLLHKIHT